MNNVKSNAITLQAWTGPEGSRRFRQLAHKGANVVSPTLHTSLHYPPGNIPGTHFC